ncbi:MAG: magnesium/cobalt transporter CorA [Candidatus Aminicenantes bacterium]|nr:magnesium/cobalt transporter CorA [Candidatus Aminicenantes bacterium]
MRSRAGREAKRSPKEGLPPGSLVHVGERKVEHPRITVMDYDGDIFLEKTAASAEECAPLRETATTTWINVDGVHEAGLINGLGGAFGLHPLILEDIMTTAQRPKLEDLGTAVYIVLKMIELDEKGEGIVIEQLSLVFGSNFVLSFQERPGDMFDHVRERLRQGRGRIRKMGADYLAYSLLDAVVDHYFVVLEGLGEKIDRLEDELMADPDRATLHRIHALKREMIFLRKSVWPLREILAKIERIESDLVRKPTAIFFRDVYDHAIQVIDSVETFREVLSGMLETYLSSVSNRMNEVMKVLTIIATIFIPLTFIAGVYGMNFEHMPELKWRAGYFIVWGVMIALGGGMAVLFRRRKWL